MTDVALVYLGWVTLLSLAAFALYGFDKHRARTRGRRIPEITLHMLALVGGWPGAWAGQRVFHHKTRKFGYQVIFWLCVALHLAVVWCGLVMLQSRAAPGT